MSDPLPARANLAWLRKTAKQQLRTMRAQGRDAKLAEAQFAVARQYGFSSWRSLKAHIDQLSQVAAAATRALADEEVAKFLRAVGDGRMDEVRAGLAAERRLVNAVGPHPYWGGRPQALHVAVETRRRNTFDLLLAAGADINGSNDQYEHWSPLMLAFHWNEPGMRQALIDRGARIGLVEAMLLEDDAMVERLLRPGKAALPANEPNGGSLLAFARTPFAIDRLLELGVSPDKKDRWDTSPVEAMSRLGPRGLPLVRHLVSRGLKAEPQEYARLGDKESLTALIAVDDEIARRDAVMMGAVEFGHHDMVRWLLDRGANVNARAVAGSGGTALHSAAWNGDLPMVKLLVAAGADVSACDPEHDNTPAGWAEVALTVSNNPKCKDVLDYLSTLSKTEP
jgi:ankyrin repeat protein